MSAASETQASPVLRLHANDDVVIARRQLVSGTTIAEENVTVSGLVPPGHKLAVRAMVSGAPVRRYDQIIGFASRDIRPGEHVHLHNMSIGAEHGAFARDYAFCADAYIGILSTVNCSATVVRAIADRFRRDVFPQALAGFANVDGVVALTHGTGCGMDMGDSMTVLRRTLGGYARHPNFGAVLVIGLGCEANQVAALLGAEALREGERLRTYNLQEVGGTAKAIERGVALVREMLPMVDRVERRDVPASHLVLGLQCGGSDGTAILSETPEIYGAEHLLTRRAVSREVGEKLIARIRWWEDYTARNRGEMNNNPSPGNKAGGLTTILEKSLGAVAKGGTTSLVDVYEYAQAVTARGFVFMDTPGYDPVSATGQVAGGANLIVFTTGRGSAYGCAPSPSLKLSTNSELWRRQEADIDINCGGIADGEETIEAVGERIFELVLATASGRKSKSELHGYGQQEFVPWQLGAVM